MDLFSTQFLVSLLQVIWIDILLSGDNAVVIALACRSLPAHQRRTGILLGAGTAVGLRIALRSRDQLPARRSLLAGDRRRSPVLDCREACRR